MRSSNTIPFILVTVLTVAIGHVFSTSEDYPLVNTTVGAIRGQRSEDGDYSMFLGVPYATIDKRNPFGASVPNPTFDDIFDAFDGTVACPQVSSRGIHGSLDCLTLNIYVPDTTQNRLPVLVFIYGGRFMMGSAVKSTYGPKFLTRHDVILVVLNYRIGVYGFMSLNTADVPGNQGLKDQLNALRWIKQNIGAFGGDEENITLFGESAGGVSADFHLLHSDDGLFHKVITQSGTSLSPWAIEEPDLNAPLRLARVLGFNTNDVNAALNLLTNQSTNRVVGATALLRLRFVPCVEKEFPGVESFMTVHSVSTPVPRAKDIPLLSGYNDDESLMTYANLPAIAFQTLDIFNYNMGIGFNFGDKHKAMERLTHRFYAGDEPMSVKLRRPVTDFESDFLFVHPTQRTIHKYLDYGGDVYHYVFSFKGGRNMMRTMMNITEGGASHADELGYLFDMDLFRNTPSPEDQLIIDRMTTLWTNFAKFGNPTPSTSTVLPVQWLPVTKDRLHYLDITTNMTLGTRPFNQRLTFWDFFYETNREYIKGQS
ncbi:bile salt-activated lipase-like [Epargyreus clarus]|uniref:bile salt-activated lipase-like n=1 Tax=Epargyreus clarus TaxID=520877 RepID=UPI003C2BE08F